MPFVYETKIQLHDTDAAGILFFGNQFKIAHDVYQAFLESHGFHFREILRDGQILIPIVHAEADYLKTLSVGDLLAVELSASKISAHSFVLNYRLVNDQQGLVGTAETVHVAIDRKSKEKVKLPDELRAALESVLNLEP